MSTTPRNLRCKSCGRGPSYAKDKTLEETGVCHECTRRSSKILDKIGRPIQTGDKVVVNATDKVGFVVGSTAGRKTMVDVKFEDGRVVAFYGTSLYIL